MVGFVLRPWFRPAAPATVAGMSNATNTREKGAKPLSVRHERFCQAIVDGMNAGDAYHAAGYRCTRDTARANGARLLTNANVRARISKLRGRCEQACQMTREDVIRYLSRAIRTPVSEIGPNDPLAQEVTVDSVGKNIVRTRIKIVSKMDALKQLAAMCGWNAPEKIEVETGPVTRSSIEESIARLRIESPLIRRKIGQVNTVG